MAAEEQSMYSQDIPHVTHRREDPVHKLPYRSYDALGRKQPARLDWWTFARAIPGYAALFDRTVPPEYVGVTDDEQVMVACPCGEHPALIHAMPVECGCGRLFVALGSQVRVAFGPERR